jgi:hypothetical protein
VFPKAARKHTKYANRQYRIYSGLAVREYSEVYRSMVGYQGYQQTLSLVETNSKLMTYRNRETVVAMVV